MSDTGRIFSQLLLVCLLLLGIPYLFLSRRFWCLACGNRWTS